MRRFDVGSTGFLNLSVCRQKVSTTVLDKHTTLTMKNVAKEDSRPKERGEARNSYIQHTIQRHVTL